MAQMSQIQALDMEAEVLEHRLLDHEPLTETEYLLIKGFLLLSARIQQISLILLDRSSN